jgi:hypothetical protein
VKEGIWEQSKRVTEGSWGLERESAMYLSHPFQDFNQRQVKEISLVSLSHLTAIEIESEGEKRVAIRSCIFSFSFYTKRIQHLIKEVQESCG